MNSQAIKVWDPLVRLFHWLLAGSFFVAYFSEEDWMDWHIWAGYLVFGLIVWRVLWGFIGPAHTRFSDFVYSPRRVWQYTAQVLQLKAPRYIGHNPAGGAMIVILLLCLLITTLSGVAFYGADAWLGPLAPWLKHLDEDSAKLLKEVHEIFANLTLFLVAVHVGGVLWESWLHRENLVKSMITGNKRQTDSPFA